uniref:CRISPR-associated protein Cas5 n=1 Tax=candidate division WOR-3 bacterium TaxID=2052148 RepID=A0A7V3ZSH6_UNCW3
MKALVFNIRLNSLYSIRIPFTWQSALTYPVLPPSAVIGMLSNALQRYKNDKHPLEYLELIEDKTLWAGSRLLTPCVIKSYTTSTIVKWEDTHPWKFTNVLDRQFAYSRQLQVLTIFKDDSFIDDLIRALKRTPLTCGDSESLITIDNEVFIKDVFEVKDEIIITEYPLPFNKNTKVKGGKGRFYLMHERCKKEDTNFPLRAYLIPVEEREGILYPSSFEIERTSEKFFKVSNVGYVVIQELT